MNSMQKSMENVNSYSEESEFSNFHLKIKNEAIEQFKLKVSIGGMELAMPFQQKLDENIEQQFKTFEGQNNKRREIVCIYQYGTIFELFFE